MVDYERIKYSINSNYDLRPEQESALLSQLRTLQTAVTNLGKLAGKMVLAKKFKDSKTAAAAQSKNIRASMVLDGINLSDDSSRVDVAAAFDFVARQMISVQEFIELISGLTQSFGQKSEEFRMRLAGRGKA
jgi:hypothetical protein